MMLSRNKLAANVLRVVLVPDVVEVSLDFLIDVSPERLLVVQYAVKEVEQALPFHVPEIPERHVRIEEIDLSRRGVNHLQFPNRRVGGDEPIQLLGMFSVVTRMRYTKAPAIENELTDRRPAYIQITVDARSRTNIRLRIAVAKNIREAKSTDARRRKPERLPSRRIAMTSSQSKTSETRFAEYSHAVGFQSRSCCAQQSDVLLEPRVCGRSVGVRVSTSCPVSEQTSVDCYSLQHESLSRRPQIG
jgi:hypothetical protein